jgi:hypothetical protein
MFEKTKSIANSINADHIYVFMFEAECSKIHFDDQYRVRRYTNLLLLSLVPSSVLSRLAYSCCSRSCSICYYDSLTSQFAVCPARTFTFRSCSKRPLFSLPKPFTTSRNSYISSASVIAQGISLSRLLSCTTRICNSSLYFSMRAVSKEWDGSVSHWQHPCDFRRRMAAILGGS